LGLEFRVAALVFIVQDLGFIVCGFGLELGLGLGFKVGVWSLGFFGVRVYCLGLAFRV
jgi:hypothetical protein